MGRPDVLIHLAWGGLPNYKSLHHFDFELPKQYFFLRSLVNQGLKFIVVTGTCFEYGMQYGGLSSDISTHPTNPYGFAKDALRSQLQYLQLHYPFKLIWARLFYLYGPGQSKNSLLSQLEHAVSTGEKQFKMSGGEQLRDYLLVSEVANQLITLAKQKPHDRTLNICSGKPQSVRTIVENHIKNNNWNIDLDLGHFPYPDYEPMAFWGVKDNI